MPPMYSGRPLKNRGRASRRYRARRACDADTTCMAHAALRMRRDCGPLPTATALGQPIRLISYAHGQLSLPLSLSASVRGWPSFQPSAVRCSEMTDQSCDSELSKSGRGQLQLDAWCVPGCAVIGATTILYERGCGRSPRGCRSSRAKSRTWP
eukprot:366018-Chlamydomonas_euryale.AAC.8